MSFQRGRSKVRVPTEEMTGQPKGMTLLYAEDMNMLGVDNTKPEAYLDDHPRIIPLFEIDVIETAADYASPTTLHEEAYEPDPKSIMEEVNVGTTSDPRLLSIAKELLPDQKRGDVSTAQGL